LAASVLGEYYKLLVSTSYERSRSHNLALGCGTKALFRILLALTIFGFYLWIGFSLGITDGVEKEIFY
jgi:hypothetical protein